MDKNVQKPNIINNLFSTTEQSNLKSNIYNILSSSDVCIWNSSINPFLETKTIMKGDKFFKKLEDNKYFLTVDEYNEDNDLNNLIKKKFIEKCELPNYLTQNKLELEDANMWISSNYTDSGLHFDDTDGLLYVLDGEKQITLYSPNDSKYLEPFSTLPIYARQKPLFMYYNEYSIIKEIAGKPSELILFKSLEYLARSKKVFEMIEKIHFLKENEKKLIWGCKKHNNVYRWEVYYYHYEHNDIEKINKDSINNILVEGVSESIINDLKKTT
jgi:hypothetical protein